MNDLMAYCPFCGAKGTLTPATNQCCSSHVRCGACGEETADLADVQILLEEFQEDYSAGSRDNRQEARDIVADEPMKKYFLCWRVEGVIERAEHQDNGKALRDKLVADLNNTTPEVQHWFEEVTE